MRIMIAVHSLRAEKGAESAGRPAVVCNREGAKGAA